MTIKKGDFVEIDFVGKLKESDKIFDLTKEDIAKKNNIHNPKLDYKPIIICIGERQVIKGVDDSFIGKDKGNYKVEVKPEEGFGKKDAKLMKIVSLGLFRKQKINPFPGLQVNIDGLIGTIRSVSGGRVIVDFNHPLAGRELIYEIEIKRIIKDIKEKVKSIIDFYHSGYDIDVEEGNVKIKADLPKEIEDIIKEKVKKLVSGVKKIDFVKQLKKDK